MHCVFINMFCLLTNVLMKQGIENIKINMISKTCVLSNVRLLTATVNLITILILGQWKETLHSFFHLHALTFMYNLCLQFD